MARSASVAGMKVIPSGYRAVHLPNGQVALQKATRRRRRYKLSKTQRNKLARARRQFKIPILTSGALAAGIGATFADYRQYWSQSTFSTIGMRELGYSTLKTYTGFDPRSKSFKPAEAIGLWSLLGLAAVKKIGRPVLSYVNREIAKTKLPIRLS